jgi:putative serine/threonine protein kinase
VRELQSGEVIALEELREEKYCNVLCYPRCKQKELERRLEELHRIGVQNLEFIGEKTVFDVPVIGKGCVGVVIVAYTRYGKAALKIRRVDADRKEMFHEGEMLRKANKIGVGTKLFEISENFLLMELIEGKHFPEWIKSLKEKDQSRLRMVLKNILEQCYNLDESGLDHGELSNAQKHIIIDLNGTPHLIDFETASVNRRVSNVSSVCQYLFLGSQIAHEVNENLGEVDKKKLIDTIRNYKHQRTKNNFEKILNQILF